MNARSAGPAGTQPCPGSDDPAFIQENQPLWRDRADARGELGALLVVGFRSPFAAVQ